MLATVAELMEYLVAAARIRLPELSWGQGSENHTQLTIQAVLHRQLLDRLARLELDILPTKCSEAVLEQWGEVLKTPRKGPSIATGNNALRVTGTATTVVPANSTLTSPAGLGYLQVSGFTIPAGGTLDVDVQSGADNTGTAANLPVGVELTWDSPPAGLDATAVVVVALGNAVDQEPLEDYRARVVLAFTSSGAMALLKDIETESLALDGAESVYIYPGRSGVGNLDVAILQPGTGSAKILSTASRLSMETALRAKKVRATGPLRALVVTPVDVDIDIRIKVKTGSSFLWDWETDPIGGALTVNSTTPGDPAIVFTTDLPASMSVGDGIIPISTIGAGRPLVVEAITASNTIRVRELLYAVSVSELVYPAGGLTTMVRDAVIAYIDALGPAGANADPLSWEDSISPSRLEGLLFQAFPDIREIEVVEPATTVTPTDDLPVQDTIQKLVPRKVVIRRLP